MNGAPAFDFTVTYDAASLRAAVRVLFVRYWRWLLPWTALAALCVIFAVFLLWYVGLSRLIPYVVLYAGACLILWIFTRWNIQRRLMRRLGKSAQIRLTPGDFSISSEGESHTFPWTQFKFSHSDERNLYLFMSKTVAFVLPTSALPDGAQQFVIAHIGGRANAV